MAPKEQAILLFEKHYYCNFFDNDESAKKHAIITVENIINVILFNKEDDKYWQEEDYWKEVKKELQKL